MQPIDWNQTVLDPVGSMMKGVQLREGVETAEYNQVVRAKALEEFTRQEELRQGLSTLLSSDEEVTSDKLFKYTALMDPRKAQEIRLMWEQKGKDEKTQLMSDSSKVISALNSQRPDLAAQFLLERAARSRNAGKEKSALEDEELAERVKTSPKSVLAEMVMTLGATEDGRRMFQNMEDSELMPLRKNLLTAQTDAAKALADERDFKAKGGTAGGRDYLAEYAAEGLVDPTLFRTKDQKLTFNNAAAIAEAEGKKLDINALRKLSAQASSTGRTAGSRLVLARKQNIEGSMQLLSDMEKTNDKLNYSDVEFIGKLEKFKNGQLNDPIFIEFMTQRADSLFQLANALKQNGVTDKSIEVEEEAFRPTLAPKAFKAWLNVQKRALNKAAEEMNKDYGFDMSETPALEPGIGGDKSKSTQGKSTGSGKKYDKYNE